MSSNIIILIKIYYISPILYFGAFLIFNIDNINIVNEYNNTYHRTIKMKPVDVKDNTYIEFEKEVNNKDPKFKIGDHVRISKYTNVFAKGYMPNWSEEVS